MGTRLWCALVVIAFSVWTKSSLRRITRNDPIVCPARLLSLAIVPGLAFSARSALDAQAASTTINIIEPSDNPDDYVFEQTSVTIKAGDSVTWVNKGLESHSVTADSHEFDSKDFDAGQSWSYTFSTPGTFTYYCDPHPWMVGTVIVEPAELPARHFPQTER